MSGYSVSNEVSEVACGNLGGCQKWHCIQLVQCRYNLLQDALYYAFNCFVELHSKSWNWLVFKFPCKANYIPVQRTGIIVRASVLLCLLAHSQVLVYM